MSKTCENVSQPLLTVNEDIGPGNECNSLTLYRAASGALVFDAGTVQWAWGLNNNHDGDENGTDPAMQQATVNLLAMMGVQPATLMSGLVAGDGARRHSPADLDDHLAVGRRHLRERQHGDGQRHRHRLRRRRGGGRRGLHRRRLDLASCDHDVR